MTQLFTNIVFKNLGTAFEQLNNSLEELKKSQEECQNSEEDADAPDEETLEVIDELIKSLKELDEFFNQPNDLEEDDIDEEDEGDEGDETPESVESIILKTSDEPLLNRKTARHLATIGYPQDLVMQLNNPDYCEDVYPSEATKWLREVYKWHINVTPCGRNLWGYEIIKLDGESIPYDTEDKIFSDYYEALEDAILKTAKFIFNSKMTIDDVIGKDKSYIPGFAMNYEDNTIEDAYGHGILTFQGPLNEEQKLVSEEIIKLLNEKWNNK